MDALPPLVVRVSAGPNEFFRVQVPNFTLAPLHRAGDDQGFTYGFDKDLGQVTVGWQKGPSGAYLELQTGIQGESFFKLYEPSKKGLVEVELSREMERKFSSKSQIHADPELEIDWSEVFSIPLTFSIEPAQGPPPPPPPWLSGPNQRAPHRNEVLWGHWLLPLASDPRTPTALLERMAICRWRPLLLRVAQNPSADAATMSFLSNLVPISVSHNPSLLLTLLTNPDFEQDLSSPLQEWLRMQREL